MKSATTLGWVLVALLVGYGAGRWQAVHSPAHEKKYAEPAHSQPDAPSLSPQQATQAINRLANTPDALSLTRHAERRMQERRLTLDDIRSALIHGEVRDVPRAGSRRDWLYKVYYERPSDKKQAEIVVALMDNALKVIAVMWDGVE